MAGIVTSTPGADNSDLVENEWTTRSRTDIGVKQDLLQGVLRLHDLWGEGKQNEAVSHVTVRVNLRLGLSCSL